MQDIINFDAYVAQQKLLSSSDITPSEDILFIGKKRPRAISTAGKVYDIFVTPVSAITGGGAAYFGDNVTIQLNPGNVFSLVSTAISQFTNDSGYITSAALTPYLTSATAAATYYPLSNPAGYITAASLPDSWNKNGNALAGGEKLGSTNNIPVDLYTNNIQRARLTTSGQLLIGTNTDSAFASERLNVTGGGIVLGTANTGYYWRDSNLGSPWWSQIMNDSTMTFTQHGIAPLEYFYGAGNSAGIPFGRYIQGTGVLRVGGTSVEWAANTNFNKIWTRGITTTSGTTFKAENSAGLACFMVRDDRTAAVGDFGFVGSAFTVVNTNALYDINRWYASSGVERARLTDGGVFLLNLTSAPSVTTVDMAVGGRAFFCQPNLSNYLIIGRYGSPASGYPFAIIAGAETTSAFSNVGGQAGVALQTSSNTNNRMTLMAWGAGQVTIEGTLAAPTTPNAMFVVRNNDPSQDPMKVYTNNSGVPLLALQVKDNGRVNMSQLPVSSVGLSSGDLWNNAGVVNIIP